MDHTLTLLQKAHAGEKAARDTLVEENTGLVWSIVRRFLNRGVDAEDLFQIGSIGLLKAIDKFDLNYEVQFSTYAVPMISGEIRRFLRDDGMVKVSRPLKELAVKARAARWRMEQEKGREVTLSEVAGEINSTTEELVMALESSVEVESLQKTIYQGENSEISLMDRLEEKTSGEERVLNRILLEQLLEKLPKEERRLIYLRYFEDKTQMEIAQELGISQVQVSRMEKKILAALRQEAADKV
ncbi:MAG: SigB/SigF/SigG family RNA polymerase sigma factor [Fusicatenibacter sp.]|nr:SigB/SigF/SigG family RNA polymerase sigma factor [Lachnospiraceae bacterium]MDY2937219.1 SigB/SigF/SigG family RNA polymerase sigma factor [Fusicatenibacter sp.]